MKFTYLLLLVSVLSYSQVEIHNSEIQIIGGSLKIHGDVTGSGKIEVKDSFFEANTIVCEVSVKEDQYSDTEFYQECGPLRFMLFDMTGKYLGSGLFESDIYFRLLERHHSQPLIVKLSNRKNFKIWQNLNQRHFGSNR